MERSNEWKMQKKTKMIRVCKSVYKNSNSGNCWWWLRSPGYRQGTAAGVNHFGGVREYGRFVDYGSDAVRPALWIDLNS